MLNKPHQNFLRSLKQVHRFPDVDNWNKRGNGKNRYNASTTILLFFIAIFMLVLAIMKLFYFRELDQRLGSSSVDALGNKDNPMIGLDLDFFIAGFPKCGTTSLLHTFQNHPDTAILDREFCSINSGKENSFSMLEDKINQELPKSSKIKRGIKCPGSIWDSRGIMKLSKKTNSTKLIIGVRHPLLFFQSYYNYRITEMHDQGKVVVPPSPESLIGEKNQWRDVSTDIARFELGLMQLGKTELTSEQLIGLGIKGRRLAPTPFKIFLYSLEQLNDSDEERSHEFRKDLQSFLELEHDILPFSHENLNNFVGKDKLPETIDICDSRFQELRRLLLKQGERTQTWIQRKFLESSDVTVGGKDNFLRIIKDWDKDPCLI